jgi:steroid 5-alpha reductase family enzyme
MAALSDWQIIIITVGATVAIISSVVGATAWITTRITKASTEIDKL